MPRGRASNVGDTMVTANGYHNTRTEDGWRATHILVVEEEIGRKLLAGETVRFKDGDRKNLSPDNLILLPPGGSKTVEARIAKLEAKIHELQEQLKDLYNELGAS